MRFTLLGPVSVGDAGSECVLPPGIPCAILVLLLLNANRVVSAEQLAQWLWGDEQPAAVGAGLRNHVLRLRRHLGPEAGARIVTAAPGYLARVEPGELDEEMFLDAGRKGSAQLRAEQYPAARSTLAAALELWRGEPAWPVPLDAGLAARLEQLREVRLAARQDLFEADLRLGRHEETIPGLRQMVREHPLREEPHAQLMVALYRSGRQADAVEVYRALHDTLTEDLGIEPSEPVRRLHQRILDADPGLYWPGGARQPDELPADCAVFVGRTRELDLVTALAEDAALSDGRGAARVCTIDGMGGVGKSAFAVRAARLLGDRFPDGHLFAGLGGHGGAGEPATTAGQALGRLLRSLGVPARLLPDGPDERAALYRSRLAGTRTLIVLDDARSTAQIRPLLPASGGCLVLVTSRRRLIGLADAEPLTLGVLPEDAATDLVRAIAGPGRVAGDEAAVADLAALCGHLPVALRFAAEHLAQDGGPFVGELVSRLRCETDRLKRLHDGERDLRDVFAPSYTSLPEPERRMFALLGRSAGPEVDVPAAARLSGNTEEAAERLLESLADHSLLVQRAGGDYVLHDLLRIYARTLEEHLAI